MPSINDKLAEQIFTWFLQEPETAVWFEEALAEDDLEIFSKLHTLTAKDVGKAALGMKEWFTTRRRTVGGALSDVSTFFTRKLLLEVSKDSFLRATYRHGVPVGRDCPERVGKAIKGTAFFKKKHTEIWRIVRNNCIVASVMAS